MSGVRFVRAQLVVSVAATFLAVWQSVLYLGATDPGGALVESARLLVLLACLAWGLLGLAYADLTDRERRQLWPGRRAR